jgi:hypothetical protein
MVISKQCIRVGRRTETVSKKKVIFSNGAVFFLDLLSHRRGVGSCLYEPEARPESRA